VNHGFETQVNLAGTYDLRDIARVIRLQQSDLDPLILEETFSLSQVQRGVIRRGVPFPPECQPTISNIQKQNGQANQFVKKVILSEDMVLALLLLSQYFPLFGRTSRGWGKEACSYRSYYADQVRNGMFSASPPVVFNCSIVCMTRNWE
jgi:hypothetical protein